MSKETTKAEKTTSLVKINAAEFGLNETKAKELEAAFTPMIKKMVELETEFNEVVNMEVSHTKCVAAKSLKNKYVKVRTGTAAIHKEQKAYYYKAGLAVDAWKNSQLFAAHGIEEKLDSIAKHFENIEKARIEKIEQARIKELSESGADFPPVGLGVMPDEVWDHYIKGVRDAKKAVDDAAIKAEADRIELEKKELAERERTRLENIQLKKEADEKKRLDDLAEIERKRVAKIESDKQAEKDAKSARALKKLEDEKLEQKRKADKIQAEKDELHAKELAKIEANNKALKVKADKDKKERDAELLRSKDKDNKQKIQREIFDYICTLTDQESAKKISADIIRNNVPNVYVKY